VWCEGGRLWIQDLGTESGSTLNDMKLPPLKPMLCREIDTLKLGASPFTISIEPVFVRAPQVKPTEAAKPAMKPVGEMNPEELNARRVELANVSRELAELKLQLQMARLEKDAVEEIKKYRERLQEQIKELEVSKNQMHHDMAEWDKDKVTFRKNLEKELADMRLQTHKDLRNATEVETKKFEAWRRGCVDEMTQLVVLLMGRKVKPLVGKTISPSQVKKLERDVTLIMRRVLLNETEAEENVVQELYNYDPKDAKRVRTYWKNFAMAISGMVVASGAVFFAWNFTAKRNAARTIASAESPAPQVAPVERPHFVAPTTPEFKRTYTDNVLYTTNFGQIELSAGYRRSWILELNKVGVSDWKLSENVIVPLVAKEMNLVQDLVRLRSGILAEQQKDGIARLRAREAQFQNDLRAMLKSKDLVDRFYKFKKSFFQKNQNLGVASNKEGK
jgi:hypothetical protein